MSGMRARVRVGACVRASVYGCMYARGWTLDGRVGCVLVRACVSPCPINFNVNVAIRLFTSFGRCILYLLARSCNLGLG